MRYMSPIILLMIDATASIEPCTKALLAPLFFLDIYKPNYNIQLLTKVSKSQKADIINAINSTNRTGKPITAAALNNILKSEKKTIPIETTQATAKAIVQTLKKKNIAAIMVEV